MSNNISLNNLENIKKQSVDRPTIFKNYSCGQISFIEQTKNEIIQDILMPAILQMQKEGKITFNDEFQISLLKKVDASMHITLTMMSNTAYTNGYKAYMVDFPRYMDKVLGPNKKKINNKKSSE